MFLLWQDLCVLFLRCWFSGDSTDGRNITLRENMLLSLLLHLNSISCLWIFCFTRTIKDCATLWKKRNNEMG